MKKTHGFTVMELLIVIAILLILMAIVISSLNLSQKRARDDRRVSTLHEIMLALEEYRDVCREYPRSLESSADNGCPTGQGLDTKLGYFLSNDALSAIQSPSQFNMRYGSFTENPGGRCTGYHIGISLETPHPSLSTDDNFDSTTLSNNYCSQTLGQLSDGFYGDSEDCNGSGIEDSCLDFKKGNP